MLPSLRPGGLPDYQGERKLFLDTFSLEKKYQPFTPPEARPLTRFFSMHINRMTTGMMAKMEAANRYCHSIILYPLKVLIPTVRGL